MKLISVVPVLALAPLRSTPECSIAQLQGRSCRPPSHSVLNFPQTTTTKTIPRMLPFLSPQGTIPTLSVLSWAPSLPWTVSVITQRRLPQSSPITGIRRATLQFRFWRDIQLTMV
ncbi:hypothetical protein Moror_11313 [Moniliophthora roreri MCA 2997]|uniref:Secreted protein n=1 Tax=Moniliophthora roreri (strain MCA 2997) TaxID=1381753 RepID=V2WEN8_MONRO|nr:hypothetical protein Moror_11313 [Moniliophthora roreri MCA 2997]